METCVGCGSPIAPTWKFCIHCGLAVEQPDPVGADGAGGPGNPASARPISNRALLLGGVGIFVLGVALLVVAIAFFAGAFQ